MTKEDLQQISELMTSALDPIHIHLNQIDKRLDAIGNRLDRVETRLDRVETRLDNMENRLDRVETCLDNVESRLDSMAEDIAEINADAAIPRTACNTLIEWTEHASAVVQVPYPYRRAE